MGYRVVLITDSTSPLDYELPQEVIRVECSVSVRDALKDYSGRGADMERIFREYEIDVMVYHYTYGLMQLWDTLLCNLLGVPIVTVYHNIFTKFLDNQSTSWMVPRIAKLNNGIAVLTEIDRTFWKCATPETPVFVLRNPLTFDLDTTQPAALEDPVIVWANHLIEKQKGCFDPVDIMREVVKRVPDAKLYMLGSDPQGTENFTRLQEKVTEAGLNQSVILCGFQTNVIPYYQKSSVFLLTSAFEGWGMSLAEAMTFGLPVVMYDLPYLTLVRGNEGLVSVPQGDIQAAAEAICELLENQEHRREVGRRGREFIENLYAGDKIAEQWQCVFDALGQPDAAPEEPGEPEIYRLLVQNILEQRTLFQSAPVRPQTTAATAASSASPSRFPYGDVTHGCYAELRSSGPEERRTVSFVTEQDGKKTFHILLNSDGQRNWVTPKELKRLSERSGAPETALEAKVADLTEQLKQLQVHQGTPEELKRCSERSGAPETALEAKVANLKEQLKQLQIHQGTVEELRKTFIDQTGKGPCVRFPYGDVEKQQYVELRTNGPRDKREVSLVSSQQDGQQRFNILLNSDGTRNWVTPEELTRLTKRSGESETALEAKVADLKEQLKQLQVRQVTPEELKRLAERSGASETALEAKVADLKEQFKQLQVRQVTPEELQKALSAHVGDRLRILYGDVEKQQYAELRTNGPRDKREVSLVSSQQDGQQRFNILLNSDGTRNWVTPEELTRLTERSGASETALEAKVADLKEQFKQLQAHQVTPEELKRLTEHSSASEAALEAKVADQNEQIKQLQAHRGTLEELRKTFTGQTGEWPCVRFLYGDVEKQQYVELRTNGPKDKREVSLVSAQQDGKKRFNILLNSDGTRNWVTPEELKTLSEHSGTSEAALEAKIAELSGKLERLEVLYDSLAEKRKVCPNQSAEKENIQVEK